MQSHDVKVVRPDQMDAQMMTQASASYTDPVRDSLQREVVKLRQRLAAVEAERDGLQNRLQLEQKRLTHPELVELAEIAASPLQRPEPYPELTMNRDHPGSPAAIARGCTCSVAENAHGRGRLLQQEGSEPIRAWWIAADCPIHNPTP